MKTKLITMTLGLNLTTTSRALYKTITVAKKIFQFSKYSMISKYMIVSKNIYIYPVAIIIMMI